MRNTNVISIGAAPARLMGRGTDQAEARAEMMRRAVEAAEALDEGAAPGR